jgi:hypothetical protein
MDNINGRIRQKDELLANIKLIEADCEGIENESNASRISELTLKKNELATKGTGLRDELSSIENEINGIDSEIGNLSGSGMDKILEAIKNQRWYFFKNKPKIIMDRNTGILWANLDYFQYNKSENANDNYSREECNNIIENLSMDGITDWILPKHEDFKYMIRDKSFPFKKGTGYCIKSMRYWYCDIDGYDGIDLDNLSWNYSAYSIMPCCYSLTNPEYASNVSKNSKIYTEKERLNFTLNIFIENNLQPMFVDDKITELFRRVHVEKPELIDKYAVLKKEIDEMQRDVLLSSTFNYRELLLKYNLDSINSSVIQYYESVIAVVDDLMNKVSYFENEKNEIINDLNIMAIKLSGKYDDNPNMTDYENELFKKRQGFFKKNFDIGMNTVKDRLISVKSQAIAMEDNLERINNSDNAIKDLAAFENENRVSFEFLVENSVNTIIRALKKIEFFESNSKLVKGLFELLDQWDEDYNVFKTTLKGDLINSCKDDSIESEVYDIWYEEWQKKRYIVENRFMPVIEYALKGKLTYEYENNLTIAEKIIKLLKEYKDRLDDFYLEERMSIHQKFAFQSGGDLQEKFETESELYKYTGNFQNDLHRIVLALENKEDSLFLLKWAKPIINIEIDEILEFVGSKKLSSISIDVLKEFSDLKQNNFDAYISDSKSYSDELKRREKEYNSLVFKMRKDLMK